MHGMAIVIRPETLAFLTTTQCPIECKMCCFSCGPSRKEKLPFELMKDIMHQAKRLKAEKNTPLRLVGLTGGEPFLRLKDLKELVNIATSLGFDTSCTTNGFWAADEEKTYIILKELQALGLKKLGLSCDHFHQEFIPIERIKNILIAVKKLKLATDMGSIITKSTADTSFIYKNLKHYMESVPHYTAACLPVGAAKENIVTDDYLYDETIFDTKIKCFETKYFSIYEDGEVFSCCSQAGRAAPLSLGNVYSASLFEIHNAYYSNIHLRIIKKQGLAWYVNLAASLKYKDFKADAYVNKCHLCNKIFSDAKFMDIITPFVLEYENAIYEKYLRGHSNK